MIRWVVRNAAPIVVAVIAVFIFGGVSYVTMPREAAPDVKVPFVMVNTPYIGVSPKDMESLVTVPVENELAGLKGLKVMRSTSAEGISSIFLEFEPDIVIEDALQKVRDRVNRARRDLPDDVEEPIVREISFTDIPVLIVTIAGDEDETVLKELGEALEDEVSRVNGVLEADVTGGTEREFQVLLDPARLQHYALSFNDVSSALQAENQNIPGGIVKTGAGNVLLRVPAELEQVAQLEDVPVKLVGGNLVHVRDLGRVTDTMAERATYARMNGRPAVSVSVKKRTGANIVSIADEVKAIAARQAETWPDTVEYRILADQSEAIRDMVTELQNNILTALVLVVGVILFFMGVRNSLFVALAIPLSMFSSFAVLQMLGFTLNMVVLFALILALGMLVDNAIVVVENIYRHLELGKQRWHAAIDGTREVALAVAASTATTVAAFFPLVFWSGIMGQFMGYLPKTLIIVLIASLIVAVLILPVFTSRLMVSTGMAKTAAASGSPEENLRRIEARELEIFENPGRIMGWYKALLQFSIRWRYLALSAGVLGLLGTFAVYAVFNHGVEFFPSTEPDRAVVEVRGPDGTDLETTDRIVRRVEGILAEESNVDVFVSEVGVAAGGGGRLLGNSTAPQSARITVDFLPHPASADPEDTPRSESSDDTVLRLRRKLATLTGAEIKIAPEEMGPPVGNPIEVKVRGNDFHLLGETAQRLKRRIADIDNVTDIADNYRVNRPELALRIDRGAAKQVGVDTRVVGGTVRTAVAGTTATTIRDGEDEYDVTVKLAPEFTEDVQRVLDLRMPARLERDPDTYMVPLSAVASYDLAGGSGAVQHIDQQLTITITGDVVEGAPVDQAQKAVQNVIDGFDFPPGISAELGGSSTEQDKAAEFLLWAMGVAVALIAIVLVTQFNDIVQPIIIIATVVLSLIGVLWGLLLTGTPFGIMMTGIGVISLAGVVVNNAIVLLDYVAQLRREGHTVEIALVRAGMTRFRPVMLTAITTVLGLVPMALGIAMEVNLWWVADAVPVPTLRLIIGSQSSAFWGPMAVAVIFGLSFATLLTLVMVPTLYSIYNDLMKVIRPRGSALPVLASKLALVGAGAWFLLAPRPAEAVDLEQAWLAAQEHSPDLAIVRESTFQARNQRLQAYALVLPKVSAQANYGYLSYGDVLLDFSGFFEPFGPLLPEDFEIPEPTVVQKGSNWDGSLTVSQPLFNGAAFPLMVGAFRQIEAAEHEETRTDQQVRAGVARAFYGLLAAREGVGIAEKALETARSQLELAERQVAAGLATKRAVLQGKLGVAQADRDLKRSQERLAQAEEGFHKVTGLPRDVPLEQGSSLELPASLEQAQQDAEGTRPDLAASRIRERVAGLQVRAETLRWLPTVDARWTGIYNQTSGFAGENTYWQLGVSAQWTLWDGGARLAAIRNAASQQRQARLSIEKTELDVHEQVRVAWEAYERTRLAVDAVEAEVALAQENLDLARRGFEAGTATFLEVEQADLGLRSAELTALSERTALELAAVDLLVATGQL